MFNREYLSDTSSLSESDNEEKMYASIARSFVPVELLPVLAINCIPSNNEINNLPRYWELLQRYAFLEHIKLNTVPDDLRLFTLLNGYSKALGEHDNLDNKIESLLSRHKELDSNLINKDNYLYKNKNRSKGAKA